MKKLIALFLAACMAVTPFTAIAATETDQQKIETFQSATAIGDLSTTQKNQYDPGETFSLNLARIAGKSWKLETIATPSVVLKSQKATTLNLSDTFNFIAMKPGEVTLKFTNESMKNFTLSFDITVSALTYGDVAIDKLTEFDIGKTFQVKLLRYESSSWIAGIPANDSVSYVGKDSDGKYDIFTYKTDKAGDIALKFSYPGYSNQDLIFTVRVKAPAYVDYGDVKKDETVQFTVGDSFKIKTPVGKYLIDINSFNSSLIEMVLRDKDAVSDIYNFKTKAVGTTTVTFTNIADGSKITFSVKVNPAVEYGDVKLGQTTAFNVGDSFKIKTPLGKYLIDISSFNSSMIEMVLRDKDNFSDIYNFKANAIGTTAVTFINVSDGSKITFYLQINPAQITTYGDVTKDVLKQFKVGQEFKVILPGSKNYKLGSFSNTIVGLKSTSEINDNDVFTFTAKAVGKVTLTFKSGTEILSFPIEVVKADSTVPTGDKFGNLTLNVVNEIELGKTFTFVATRVNKKTWVVNKLSNSNVSYSKKTTKSNVDTITFKAAKVGTTKITLKSGTTTLIFNVKVVDKPVSNLNTTSGRTLVVNQPGKYTVSTKSGYTWTISRSDGKVLSYYKKETGSGTNTFYFRGLKKGKCTITFKYYQVKGSKQYYVRSETITVNVK